MSKLASPCSRTPYIALSRASFLSTLAAPKPDRLPVLLQLRDQLIALLDDIYVLLVLVVRSIRLNDLVHTVNGARDAVCGNEVGEVPVAMSVIAAS
jgi:hypothetical protein